MKNRRGINGALLLCLCAAGCQSYYQKAAQRENPGQGLPVFSGATQPPPDPNQPSKPPPLPPTAPDAKPAAGRLAPDASGAS